MSDSVRKNFLPTLASLALHAGLIGGLYYWENHREPPPKTVEVQIIEAKLVSLKTKVKDAATEDTRKVNKVEVSQAVEKEQDVKAHQEEERKASAEKLQEETEKQAKVTAEKQAKELEKQAQEELSLLRKEQEKVEKKQAEEKAKSEAKAQEEKAKAEEIAKKQEEKRKSDEKEKREKLAERKRQELSQAKVAQERRVKAEQSDEAANSYLAVLKERVERKWNRPPSARNGMSCELRIKLVPTGRIVDVDVVNSSGSDEFDRSAEQAVRAVEKIDELKGMDPDMFERDFREVNILFRPEDLRL